MKYKNRLLSVVLLLAGGFFLMAFICHFLKNADRKDKYISNIKSEEIESESIDTENTETEQTTQRFDLPINREEKQELEENMHNAAAACAQVEKESGRIDTVGDINTKIDENTLLTMVKNISESGVVSGLFENETDYEKYDLADTALNQIADGQAAQFTMIQIYPDGRLLEYIFDYDGHTCTLLTAIAKWDTKGNCSITYENKSELKTFTYTQKGWFIFERYMPTDTTEVMKDSEMIRILPLPQEYRDFCERYIAPVSYVGNNLFLIDWDENSMDGIDLTALYDVFYKMDHKEQFPVEESLQGIDKKVFEEQIERHLSMTNPKIEEMGEYDASIGKYPWNRLGCGNYQPSMWSSPVPEVVDLKELGAGNWEVTVDALWAECYTDKAFSQKIVVNIDEDGNVIYLSNHILPSDENVFPTYQKRIDNASFTQ